MTKRSGELISSFLSPQSPFKKQYVNFIALSFTLGNEWIIGVSIVGLRTNQGKKIWTGKTQRVTFASFSFPKIT